MKLRVQQGSILTGKTEEAGDISYVIVYSDEGDPILVAEQVGRDHIQVTHAGEKGFAIVLARMGVKLRMTT